MFPLRYSHQEKSNTEDLESAPAEHTSDLLEGLLFYQAAFATGVLENDQAARLISIARLNALLRLHLRPIDLVVYKEPLGGLPHGISHLEVGFALRCFQRLSLPNIATQRCLWRDNWYTRGSSIPVLSY